MNYIAIPGMKYREMTNAESRKGRIIESVCSYFSISFHKLLTKRRYKELVLARQIIIYFLRKHLGLSWTEIGKVFNRDHTTAIHSFTSVRDYFDTDEWFRKQVMEIENKILS